jgi:alanine dehydrogenase
MFEAGSGVQYYAVDHTPSLLWRSATFEISRALLPYLATVMGGPDAWAVDDTIREATEICEGRILNPKIVSFQKRAAEYPHPKSG